MASNKIYSILRVFDICGLVTGSLTKPKYKKIITNITIFHSLLASILTIHLGFKAYEYYSTLGIIDAINEILHFSTLLATYWIMLINSYMYRHKLNAFWIEYVQIRHEHVFNSRLFLWMIVEFFAVKVLTIAIFLYENNISLILMLPYLYVSYMSQIKVFHYLFYLRIMRSELTFIVHELDNSSGWQLNQCTIRRITEIRYLHSSIHTLIDQFNGIHSWANVTALLCQFYTLLWTSNWVNLHIEYFTYTTLTRKLSRVFGYGIAIIFTLSRYLFNSNKLIAFNLF